MQPKNITKDLYNQSFVISQTIKLNVVKNCQHSLSVNINSDSKKRTLKSHCQIVRVNATGDTVNTLISVVILLSFYNFLQKEPSSFYVLFNFHWTFFWILTKIAHRLS
jgi:hypothetical protein